MTEVLRISPSPEPPYMPSSLKRSSSHTSILINSRPLARPGPNAAIGRSPGSIYAHTDRTTPRPSCTSASPHISSGDLSSESSTSSTPLSSLSLQESSATEDEEDDELLGFPNYEHKGTSLTGLPDRSSTPTTTETVDRSLPPIPPASTPERSAQRTTHAQSVGDDTALAPQPTRHVDYLSYDWAEEDIWSSWKHIIGRRGVLENWKRLENASWRAWAKSRRGLPTVPPERVNWMKDHDVTWLYGPLQSKSIPNIKPASPTVHSRLARSDSFGLKKSCLKKRSLSEVMLQRSLSTSSLVRQAVDSIVSQWPSPHRDSDGAMPNFLHRRQLLSSSNPSDTPSELTSLASTASSGVQTPNEVRCRKRHIQFSEEVEQCIAIDDHDEEDGIDEDDEEANQADDEEIQAHINAIQEEEDDFSDDGIIMMKPEHSKERKLSSVQPRPVSISLPNTPRGSFSDAPPTPPPGSASKTIAKLPTTRLKYRSDTPEPRDTARASTQAYTSPNRPGLVSSASQETLKPSRPSSNYLLDDDDEVVGWQPTAPVPRQGNDVAFLGADVEEAEMRTRGLRRTASGMFMPYDESADGDDTGSLAIGSGVINRVVDTVNTARDIAHVIWNVGLRR